MKPSTSPKKTKKTLSSRGGITSKPKSSTRKLSAVPSKPQESPTSPRSVITKQSSSRGGRGGVRRTSAVASPPTSPAPRKKPSLQNHKSPSLARLSVASKSPSQQPLSSRAVKGVSAGTSPTPVSPTPQKPSRRNLNSPSISSSRRSVASSNKPTSTRGGLNRRKSSAAIASPPLTPVTPNKKKPSSNPNLKSPPSSSSSRRSITSSNKPRRSSAAATAAVGSPPLTPTTPYSQKKKLSSRRNSFNKQQSNRSNKSKLPSPKSPVQQVFGTIKDFMKEVIALDQTDELNRQHERQRYYKPVNVNQVQSTSDKGLLLRR